MFAVNMFQAAPPFYLICLSLMISACASTPPKKVSKAPKLWSNLIKPIEAVSDGSLAPKKTMTHHEFWTESTEGFPLSRLEATLAESGVLAESYGSDNQYEITVGPGTCKSQWLALNQDLKTLKTERISQCLRQKITPLESLKKAKSLVKITCQGLSGGGLIDLHNMVVSISKALVSPQAQEGEKVLNSYQEPTWFNAEQARCGQIKKLNQFLSQDHLRFEETKLSEGLWAVATQGMTSFGLSEISLVMIPQERLENAKERILAAADFALRVEGLQKGQFITSGIAKGMYVPMSELQKEYLILKNIPTKLGQTMSIVDPAAPVKDLEAFKKFVRKFTVR